MASSYLDEMCNDENERISGELDDLLLTFGAGSGGAASQKVYRELLCRIWESSCVHLKWKLGRDGAEDCMGRIAMKLPGIAVSWVQNEEEETASVVLSRLVSSQIRATKRKREHLRSGFPKPPTDEEKAQRWRDLHGRNRFPTANGILIRDGEPDVDAVVTAATDMRFDAPEVVVLMHELREFLDGLCGVAGTIARESKAICGDSTLADIGRLLDKKPNTVCAYVAKSKREIESFLRGMGYEEAVIAGILVALTTAASERAAAGEAALTVQNGLTISEVPGTASTLSTTGSAIATTGKVAVAASSANAVTAAVVAVLAGVACVSMGPGILETVSDEVVAADVQTSPDAITDEPVVSAVRSASPPSATTEDAPVLPKPVIPELPDANPQPLVVFPQSPVRGQIFTLELSSIGLAIPFVFSPGNSNTADVWISRTEITQAQWNAVSEVSGLRENPSYFPVDNSPAADLPVEYVTPEDAELFCRELSRFAGARLRIPSLTEWTQAATDGSGVRREYIARPNELPRDDEIEDVAWYGANSGGRTHPVGKKQPNELGIYDIFGNVFEIVGNAIDGYQITGASWSYESYWCKAGYPSEWSKENSGTGFRIVHQPE